MDKSLKKWFVQISDLIRIRTWDRQIRKSSAYLENVLYLVYSEQFTNIFWHNQIYCTTFVPHLYHFRIEILIYIF